ncbi:MAG: hypothetical protein WDO69_28450 [Pseudomonadota bacterium]
MTSPFPHLRLLLLVGVALSGLLAGEAKADSTFVYVNANPSEGPNTVAALRVINGESTVLSGSPFPTGGLGLALAPGADFTHRVVIARKRNLLFVSNDGSGSIAVFAVDPTTGSLTAVPGSPFSVGGWGAFSGISLALSPDGNVLYASGKTIIGLSVAANGALSEIGASWGFVERVAGIAVNPDNTRLFLGMASGVVALHGGSAGLTADPPDTLSIGSMATDLRLSSNGTRLWVTTQTGGIQGYGYDSGSFSVVPGSPFASGVSVLGGITVDSSDRFLVAYSPSVPRLLSARINADGSLGSSTSLSPVFRPLAAALSPAGSVLFAADGLGQLDAWNAASDGTLIHILGFPLLTSAQPGFPSVATYPVQNPVPGAPTFMIWALCALLLGTGWVALRRGRRFGSALISGAR